MPPLYIIGSAENPKRIGHLNKLMNSSPSIARYTRDSSAVAIVQNLYHCHRMTFALSTCDASTINEDNIRCLLLNTHAWHEY